MVVLCDFCFLFSPGGRSPGPISNDRLLTHDHQSVRRNLKHKQDYELVSAADWEKLHEKFGGGPELSLQSQL